jgi:hypothetical protein
MVIFLKKTKKLEMKLKYLFYMILPVVLVSCDSSLDVEAEPEFTVNTDKNTYKVGEEIAFNFTGNPGILTFYSGLPGNDYNFKEGRVVTLNDLKLSFTSSVNFGTQPNQLSVLVSTNFSGQYNIDEIKAASWTDITDRFTLATSGTYLSSGIADITDLRVSGKPLYFVLKYIFTPGAGAGRTWAIRSFNLQSNTSNGLETLADQTNANFGLYYFGPKETSGRSSITSTTITLRANASSNTELTEDWCISKAIDVSDRDLGPDRPEKIKGYSEPRPTSFNFSYPTPGTYDVYFTGINATKKETRTLVKSIKLTIEP